MSAGNDHCQCKCHLEDSTITEKNCCACFVCPSCLEAIDGTKYDEHLEGHAHGGEIGA